MTALPAPRRRLKIAAEPSRFVLTPFDRREAISTARAAEISGYSEAHIRRLVATFDLGRRVGGGYWKVSRIALRMFLDGNSEALAAYHSGDRQNPAVRAYFEAAGLSSVG